MDAGQFGEHARAHSGMGCGVAAEGQADVIAEWLSSHIQFAPDRLAVIDVFVTETIQRYQPEGGFVDGVAPAVDKDVLPIHYRVGSVRAHDGPEPGSAHRRICLLSATQVHLKELALALAVGVGRYGTNGTATLSHRATAHVVADHGQRAGCHVADAAASQGTEARLATVHRAVVLYGHLVQFVKIVQVKRVPRRVRLGFRTALFSRCSIRASRISRRSIRATRTAPFFWPCSSKAACSWTRSSGRPCRSWRAASSATATASSAS